NPMLALDHRSHGIDGDARRLLAMIAPCDLKYAACVGENTFLDVLDPRPIHAHWHLVLGFTRHRTGVASDALAVVDYEAVFHRREVSTRDSQSYLGPLALCLVIPSEARDLHFAANCRTLAFSRDDKSRRLYLVI